MLANQASSMLGVRYVLRYLFHVFFRCFQHILFSFMIMLYIVCTFMSNAVYDVSLMKVQQAVNFNRKAMDTVMPCSLLGYVELG